MNKRYRLGEIEEAVSEMEELLQFGGVILANIKSQRLKFNSQPLAFNLLSLCHFSIIHRQKSCAFTE